jgi:hypothetical protein
VDNGLSAEQEHALEGLGAVPSNLSDLVERYAGRARLTPSDADSLLAALAHPEQVRTEPEQVAQERELVQALDQLGSSHLESDSVTAGVNADFQRPQPQSLVPPPQAATVLESAADTTEPKDGPLTRRMDARDVRVFPRKAAFSAGILGADDLPEFPLSRAHELKSAVSTTADSTSSEQTDSFEILVDEEILEIEPDDPVFDESDED